MPNPPITPFEQLKQSQIAKQKQQKKVFFNPSASEYLDAFSTVLPITPEPQINLAPGNWFVPTYTTNVPQTSHFTVQELSYSDLLHQKFMKQKESNINIKNSKLRIKLSDFYKYKPLSKYQGLIGNTKVRAPTTFIGVELELEQIKHLGDLSNSTWKITEDGSLKDNGNEYVTIPIQVKYLEIELQKLFKHLTHVNTSTRCSTHVHLNVRDFTLNELQSFLALYIIFERSLYTFSGNRWNNNFCVPVQTNIPSLEYYIKQLNQKQLSENWYKYAGLNLCPIWGGESKKFGTIEFRHMKGTTDIKYILNWINLITSLKITAKKMSITDIKEHIATMNTTSAYYWLVEETFKEWAPLLSTQATFKEDIESCISIAKQVFLSPIQETKTLQLIEG